MANFLKYVKHIKSINYNQIEFFKKTSLELKSLSRSLPDFYFKYKVKKLVKHHHQPIQYIPTIYLKNPCFQLILTVAQPKMKIRYQRQKIYFKDGGHITLDWAPAIRKIGQKYQQIQLPPEAPIFFVMHGLTGGSEMNYVKVLIQEARKKGFRTVGFNNRGICSEMTSPVPFTAIGFQQLQQSLKSIESKYPEAPIFLVGASFGSNYLTRYLCKNKRNQIKGYVGLATPFNVNKVIEDMHPIYQKFFVKRYIEDTYLRHPKMKYWQQIGLVNLKQVQQSKNLSQFHQRITIKILNLKNVAELYQSYNIGKQIEMIKVPSLFINAKDDPIVSPSSIPYQSMKKNNNIEFRLTNQGGHVCWYEGNVPKRWYPKPTLQFFDKLLKQLNHNKIDDYQQKE